VSGSLSYEYERLFLDIPPEEEFVSIYDVLGNLLESQIIEFSEDVHVIR
jgi:hypothetical protein